MLSVAYDLVTIQVLCKRLPALMVCSNREPICHTNNGQRNFFEVDGYEVLQPDESIIVTYICIVLEQRSDTSSGRARPGRINSPF